MVAYHNVGSWVGSFVVFAMPKLAIVECLLSIFNLSIGFCTTNSIAKFNR